MWTAKHQPEGFTLRCTSCHVPRSSDRGLNRALLLTVTNLLPKQIGHDFQLVIGLSPLAIEARKIIFKNSNFPMFRFRVTSHRPVATINLIYFRLQFPWLSKRLSISPPPVPARFGQVVIEFNFKLYFPLLIGSGERNKKEPYRKCHCHSNETVYESHQNDALVEGGRSGYGEWTE